MPVATFLLLLFRMTVAGITLLELKNLDLGNTLARFINGTMNTTTMSFYLIRCSVGAMSLVTRRPRFNKLGSIGCAKFWVTCHCLLLVSLLWLPATLAMSTVSWLSMTCICMEAPRQLLNPHSVAVATFLLMLFGIAVAVITLLELSLTAEDDDFLDPDFLDRLAEAEDVLLNSAIDMLNYDDNYSYDSYTPDRLDTFFEGLRGSAQARP
ncbi:unnamed protein product [Prorocentrum cordatum]|uniref:Uncharacterized protein n=1 Tax=Prorocentrum cordatum TaxID=2364126 RepID=A0ABN9W008_9DINO|nr:unnamed protein product [Polarella glacialis]